MAFTKTPKPENARRRSRHREKRLAVTNVRDIQQNRPLKPPGKAQPT